MKPYSKIPRDLKPAMKSIWQRNLVLIAKNTPVWLAQLSKDYKREIRTIDQIPDEELDKLRDFGITGLWLVGIWTRSPASRKIKHLYGNERLIASAYSIFDYSIADELGGDAALAHLKMKTQSRGIHLACDIVPNHTAIDSPWVIRHPDWYLQSAQKPVDSWNFESPDLSPDPAVTIRLEKGYYSQTGAAEVFQLKEKGSVRPIYIYHGNDGTSMPWNDTAQLNYLNPATRAAMKAEIISAAKKFSIIRLDAAMTLLRLHFKRLWFPENGEDRCIPTRSVNIMTQAEFDALMPDEFWSEVLTTLSSKAPDTLIIAEAFWMMEKYFVRSLGMHRVYNSAFINHLRDEENKIFRKYMREILISDRIILDSFVNYLTTPDEHPALETFGKGKKYFGICGLMVTLPGLPLFGHGQIEGFSEHYGMDFDRPFLDEIRDEHFIRIHQLMIAPLLRHRSRFASAENFLLIDFYNEKSELDENVLIFSNHIDSVKSLIIFNNQNKKATGRIRIPPISKTTEKSEMFPEFLMKQSGSLTLKEIRSGEETRISFDQFKSKGLALDLEPYDFHVFDVT